MTALAIIDSCNGAELRRFNAPLLANHSITVRQQIEMYYSGGESAEHRRKRTAGKRASVLDRVAAVLAAWKNGRGAKG